ncbi:MAG: DNA polymerase, partial [Nitrososphaera sp.]|nr:DNA polymerase [Nitrososphaera sp.]
HCKRLAFKLGEDYGTVVQRCKTDPAYTKQRKDIKTFSFQRAYGAGAHKIAATTGIPIAAVKEFIKSEEALYPGVARLHDKWIAEVKKNRKPTTRRSTSGVPVGTGWMQSITGKRYVFFEEDAPEWQGVRTSFRPTQIKNYEVQGFTGELIKMLIGMIYRKLAQSDMADWVLTTITVHDSVCFDCDMRYLDMALALIRGAADSLPEQIEATYGFVFDLPIRYEIKTGRNWLDMVNV